MPTISVTADVIIADMLYGKRDGSDLKAAVDDMTRFDRLQAWTSDQVRAGTCVAPGMSHH